MRRKSYQEAAVGAASLKMGREIERSVAVGRGHHTTCFLDIPVFSATAESSAFQRQSR